MSQWFKDKMETLQFLFVYKIFSLGVQAYLLSMIGTSGSSEEPMYKLATIAHMTAIVATFRAIDALIDPVFNSVKSKVINEPPGTDNAPSI